MSLDQRLTIILPLKDRVPFTLRWMHFVNDGFFPFKIIIADGGTDNSVGEILANKSNFPNVTYEYIRYPADENYTIYFKKISDALDLVETPYLLLADNDDFFSVEGIIKTIAFLEENPEYIASRGNYLGFSVKSQHADGNADNLELHGEINLIGLNYLSVSLDEKSAAGRLINYFSAWSPNWYNVYRTDIFRTCWNRMCNFNMKDIFFMEITLSALLVTKGKIFIGSYPYYYRQFGGQGSTASQDAERNLGNDWFDRMLIESWPQDYASFLKIVATSIVERDNISQEDANRIVHGAFRILRKQPTIIANQYLTNGEIKHSGVMWIIRKIYRKCRGKARYWKAKLLGYKRKLEYDNQPTNRIREFLLKKP